MLAEEHMVCLFILPEEGCRMKIWEKFVTIRTMKFWNRLPGVWVKGAIFDTELV